MGAFMGYVNFGTAEFFAVGAYSSVVLYNLVKAPLLLMIPFAGVVCGLLGLGMGYLTLRLRGVYFAIATLALAIVLETLIVNWDYVEARPAPTSCGRARSSRSETTSSSCSS